MVRLTSHQYGFSYMTGLRVSLNCDLPSCQAKQETETLTCCSKIKCSHIWFECKINNIYIITVTEVLKLWVKQCDYYYVKKLISYKPCLCWFFKKKVRHVGVAHQGYWWFHTINTRVFRNTTAEQWMDSAHSLDQTNSCCVVKKPVKNNCSHNLISCWHKQFATQQESTVTRVNDGHFLFCRYVLILFCCCCFCMDKYMTFLVTAS